MQMVSVELGHRKSPTCNICRLELAPYALSIDFSNEIATTSFEAFVSEQYSPGVNAHRSLSRVLALLWELASSQADL